MRNFIRLLTISALAIILNGCKERFEPEVIQSNLNYLVVDGFLNNSNETTNIRLSRTKKLEDGTYRAGEDLALMQLEDDNGSVLYTFQNTFDGNYTVDGMNLDASRKYRLKINTNDGKLYESDPITVKQTPSIDSVSWKRSDEAINIYVSTHDDRNMTQYYRWEYEETWEYTSNNYSFLIYENGAIRNRNPNELVYFCWKSVASSSLMLGTSAKLSKDIIYEYPVTYVPLNSEQISVLYSILVKQYALTKEAFEYLENLKKITEQMGSIFDAQPSQLGGNIHCVNNPNEPVLGFVTASTKKEQRIFIKRKDVEPWKFGYFCEPPHLVTPDSLDFYFGTGGFTPIDPAFPPGSGINGNVTPCVDCVSRGGSNVKPLFWP